MKDNNFLYVNTSIFNEREKELGLIGFYNINEKLIYENNYSLEQYLSEIIDDFIDKNEVKILSKFFKISQNFNKINFSFYTKVNDTLIKIENKDKELLSYIYDLQDTINLLGPKKSINTTTAITNNKFLKIYVKYEHKYKFLSKNMEGYIINYMHLIGKPMLNSLRYYLYNKYAKNLKLIKYNKEDIIKYKLKSFSSVDIYCNAKNCLYIYESMPINENINSNRFIKINLVFNSINIISSEFPKRLLHSMIFIPECYIFIIGGKKEKEVLLYEIKEQNNKYDKYPYLLPYDLLEPSLIYLNNQYLYAFENSKMFFQILRVDLISISPFENIELRNTKNIPINQKFFGVVRNKKSILFLGGEMMNKKDDEDFIKNCYEFHYDCNKLFFSKREFKSFDFFEKTFIPIDDNIYMQLSEKKRMTKYEPQIILFDGSKQEIQNSEKDT